MNLNSLKEEKIDEIKYLKERRSIVKSIKSAKNRGLRPIIAEIKRKSPSEGKIRDVNASDAAKIIQSGGACAISVLTDKNFDGSLSDLQDIKKTVNIPVLRKDFIIDEFQIYESYVNGADAILLITSLLRDKTKEFVRKAHELGMEGLVEIHSEDEIRYATNSDAKLIGINNRDLRTLHVDLDITHELIRKIPRDKIIVSESGINSEEQLKKVFDAGVDSALIGTSIMGAEDIKEKTTRLVKW